MTDAIQNQADSAQCPVVHSSPREKSTRKASHDWWPDRLNLRVLAKNPPATNPYGPEYDYRAKFATVDLDELRRDIEQVLTDSQDWWPADFGNYGPAFIRMATSPASP